MKSSRAWAVIPIAVGLACSGGDDATGGGGPNGTLTLEAGDAQTAAVATDLAPYAVKLVDLESQPVSGATVTWKVASGGGSVLTSSTTNAAGIAEAVATLGTIAGIQKVQAEVSGYSGSPVSFSSTGIAGPPTGFVKVSGDGQSGFHGTQLQQKIVVRATDQYANPVQGVTVTWTVTSGGGSVSPASNKTAKNGMASVSWTLGDVIGNNVVTASAVAAPQVFTATAVGAFTILGGGNNVPERYTSDLWVADGYGYTGSWGFRAEQGNAVKIWQLTSGGAPVLSDSIVRVGIGTVSDVQVSEDGGWLVFTAEGGNGSGLYVYELTTPGQPLFRASRIVANGLHTGTLATIGGKLYAFTARDPSGCALDIFDLSQAATGAITTASSTPIPDNYCIHDTFVRDGLAFVFAWNEGLYIFDVGKGSHGGSPTNPVQISHTRGFGGETHNGWWFWDPNGGKKYLFIGEEGPGVIGGATSGDIHVVDVSNLAAPVEVGSYHLAGAGTHNFWVDEQKQILYAAYYNGGVVALDVSGTLTGNLASREVARIRPGGANTFVWGVMQYNGSIYASDMIGGFWQLSEPF